MRMSDWSSDVCSSDLRHVTVTNTPGVLTEDTADMTMALILAVPRRIVEGNALIQAGNWTGWSPTGMLGHRIHGKRLGIVGIGRTGSAVARRARGLAPSAPRSDARPGGKERVATCRAKWSPDY